MREAVRFCGPLKRATVCCEAGTLVCRLADRNRRRQAGDAAETRSSIDLGVSALATLSTGEVTIGPKSHKVAIKRLRRANKAVARKRRGSHNFRKAKARLRRVHRRIDAIRRDATHKLTTQLTMTYQSIGIEDLNVRGMASNRRLARAIMDGGFCELRRQLNVACAMLKSGTTFNSSLIAQKTSC